MDKKNRNIMITAGAVVLVGAALMLQNYLANAGTDVPQEEAGAAPEELDDIELAPLVDAEWNLVANFNWLNPYSQSDVVYFFESNFDVVNGVIKTVGKTKGSVLGEAGVVGSRNNVECRETSLVDIEFTFVLRGKVVNVAETELTGVYDPSQMKVVDGKTKVLEVEPIVKEKDIGAMKLPTYPLCGPKMDKEFIKTLSTYWIFNARYLEVAYRRFPFAAGEQCPGSQEFDEGPSINTMTPCYRLTKLK